MKAVSALFFSAVLAACCRAEVHSLPDWIAPDMRFNVECDEAQAAEIAQTLALMRAALHPKMRAAVEQSDCLAHVMQWVVYVSQPGMTNDAAYFDLFKPTSVAACKGLPRPVNKIVFDRATLTNRMARLSYIPTCVSMRISYDDGHRFSRSRPVPGVDYPGVAYEDEGTTTNTICLTLRAPKKTRLFRFFASTGPYRRRDISFKVVSLSPGAVLSGASPDPKNPQGGIFYMAADFPTLKRWNTSYIAVFARAGKGPWGPPAILRLSADALCEHHYDKEGNIESIDYGAFCDWYRLAGPDRILGFTRKLPGMFRGDPYSNVGELVLGNYAEDQPRETHKVEYSVVDGKLRYAVQDSVTRHPNRVVEFRSEKW